MAKLNFNTNVTPRQDLRPVRDVSLNRTIGEIEVSEGFSPAMAVLPYKLLPIQVIDQVSDEGVVLVKGTIVSLLTNQTTVSLTVTPSGIPVPQVSGEIQVAPNAETSDQPLAPAVDWINANIDDDFFGYEQSIIGLLVPANGGASANHRYSGLDTVTATFADENTTPLTIGANMPVGVVYQDVYQDIRGFNLNYEMHTAVGFAARGFITVPFVDTNALTEATVGTDLDTETATLDTATPYYKVHRKYAFFAFDGSGGGGAAGQVLSADKKGKFEPQGTGTGTARTAQSVALLKASDSRFPKDLVATVQTYPGSKVTGTDTAGVPSMLYHFASDVLLAANGTKPTASAVLAAVQVGKFGLARMNLIL